MSERPPYRKYELVLRIGADDRDSLVRALEAVRFEAKTATAEDAPTFVDVGSDSRIAVRTFVSPDMTHEEYFRQMDAWLERDDATLDDMPRT